MTTGDVFQFTYNDKKFAFNVLEVRPGNAVSIVETDMNVDFAPPLDYVEPVYEKPKEKKQEANNNNSSSDTGLAPDVHLVPTLRDSQLALKGTGQRLGGEKKVKTEAAVSAAAAPQRTRLTLGTPTAPLANAPPPVGVGAPVAAAAAAAPAGAAGGGGGGAAVDHKKKMEDYWSSLGSGQSLKKK
jgi:ubiquitin fusion degradation protein 1